MKTADFPSFSRGFEGPQPWNGPPCGGFQAPHLAPGGDQLLRHAAVAIAQGTVAVAAYGNPIPCTRWKRLTWLVVDLPLWKNDGIRQLGSWHSQLNGKIKFMFQTTNQLTVCYGKWMEKLFIFWCTYETWWFVHSSNYQRVNDMILYQSIWCLYGVIWYGLGCKTMQDFTDFQELWGKNNPKWLISSINLCVILQDPGPQTNTQCEEPCMSFSPWYQIQPLSVMLT